MAWLQVQRGELKLSLNFQGRVWEKRRAMSQDGDDRGGEEAASLGRNGK